MSTPCVGIMRSTHSSTSMPDPVTLASCEFCDHDLGEAIRNKATCLAVIGLLHENTQASLQALRENAGTVEVEWRRHQDEIGELQKKLAQLHGRFMANHAAFGDAISGAVSLFQNQAASPPASTVMDQDLVARWLQCDAARTLAQHDFEACYMRVQSEQARLESREGQYLRQGGGWVARAASAEAEQEILASQTRQATMEESSLEARRAALRSATEAR